jgi:cytochrome P450 family 6
MQEIFSSLLLQAAALTVIVLAAMYCYIKSSYSYWTKLGVPISKPIVPFGDFFEQVIKNSSAQSHLNKLYKQFDRHRFVGLYGFGQRILLVRDIDLIRDILVKDFSHFHDRGVNISEKGNPLDQHLFMLAGAKWRNLRVKLTPTFTSGRMKMMFGTLVECGKELKEVLQEAARIGETIEIKDILARYATDVIASCAFGIQCNCLKNPDAEFRKWGRKIFLLTLRMKFFRFFNFVMPSVIKRFGVSFTPTDVSNYFTKMVTETVKYREQNGVQRNDFMQLMIQLKNKTLMAGDEDVLLPSGLACKMGAEDNKGFGMYCSIYKH